MKTQIKLLSITVAVLCLLCAGSELMAVEIFVSAQTGSDITGDGSQSFPYETIAHAVQFAINGDTITALPGVYQGSANIGLNLYIRSQQGPAGTIIQTGGASSYSFYFNNVTDTATLEGFTLEGRSCSTIDVDNSILKISRCEFRESGGDECSGGAINSYSSSVTIHDCLFWHCSSDLTAGAIYLYNSNAQIYNNFFDSNFVVDEFYGECGGIMVRGDDTAQLVIVIQNNVFMHNTSANTGALYIGHSDTYVYNNFFYANSTPVNGAAITIAFNSNPYIYNNVFTHNTELAVYSASEVWINYGNSNYYANYPTSGCPTCPASGTVYSYDPMVVDIQGGDFHLTDNSGLINRGRASLPFLMDLDFDDEPRVSGMIADIGPDEYIDCSLSGDFVIQGDTTGCIGSEILFSATGLQGFYDSLWWNFGDGSRVKDQVNVNHIYEGGGIFTVSLNMTTACTTVVITKTDFIEIIEAPTADFNVVDKAGCIPFEVEFIPDIFAPVDEYLWDFGDGTTSDQAMPVHVYDSNDVFNVRLIATNACGVDTVFKENYIEIVPDVTADFSVDTAFGSVPLLVNFTDLSLNDPIEWEWTISGIAEPYNEQNPQHRFLFPGQYDVRLVTSNECERPDTLLVENLITVYGFELEQYAMDSSRYSYRYYLALDSLYGEYDKTVSLTAGVRNLPGQGVIKMNFSQAQAVLYDSLYLDVILDRTVPAGEYEIEVIATGGGSFYKDTLVFSVTADPEQIISVSPGVLDFGEVPEDSTKDMLLSLENTLEFPDTFTLKIFDLVPASNEFSTDFEQTTNIIIGNRQDFTVSFTPPDTGEYSALLSIVSNDPAMSEYSVILSGRGILERTPPVVDSTRPASGFVQHPVTRDAIVYFSEALLSSAITDNSINATSFKNGETIDGSVIYNEIDNSLTFRPQSDFPVGDSITIIVSGNVIDLAGNSLDANGDGIGEGSPGDDYIFAFTTGFAVYPGDANNDGIVNEMDVIPLGVYWDFDGPARGLSGIWSKQPSQIWVPSRATYADCDGNGIIDMEDLIVIGSNWGLTHEVAGSPIMFTSEELKGASEQFSAIYHSIDVDVMGEEGEKIRDILSDYVSMPAGPESFYLGSNFPNPFNPTTTINFSIPVECHVHLEVFNVLGQTVKLLLDEHLSKGIHSVSWDGSNARGNPVPSGVYFYRMSAREFSQVKKMILIR